GVQTCALPISYAQRVIRDQGGVGMAIAIVKDGRVAFEKGYGTSELGKNSPVDEDTVFAIASNSKAFTTASLGILVDEGKIKWDDPVKKYLPDFEMYDPWVTDQLQIRDLVTRSEERRVGKRMVQSGGRSIK